MANATARLERVPPDVSASSWRHIHSNNTQLEERLVNSSVVCLSNIIM